MNLPAVIFIILIVVALLYFLSQKNKSDSHTIEMDVPRPNKAPFEKVLLFIDTKSINVIKQVYDQFKNLDIDFNGMEKYYKQKLNGTFNFKKALNENNKKLIETKKVDAIEELNFDHFNKNKVPSKSQQRDSKIPNKLLHQKKSITDTSHYFYGKKIVISGTFNNFPYRAEIAKLLWEVGADVDMKVTANTTILLAGKGVGWKKLETAKNEGILIMNEERFISYFPDYVNTFN